MKLATLAFAVGMAAIPAHAELLVAGQRIALPPARHDHAFAEPTRFIIAREPRELIRSICRADAIGCASPALEAGQLQCFAGGQCLEPITARQAGWCFIYLRNDLPAALDAAAIRHETGHCNGWSPNHEGAR